MQTAPANRETISSLTDTPDQHGFVIMGSQTIFLDHLAMASMSNHRYQMILEVELPDYALHQYLDDIAKHVDETYILGNADTDLFTLPELQTRERSAFVGDVFRGVPDDPNKDVPLIHAVRIRVQRVVYYRPLDQKANYPDALTYLLYGGGTEAHLSHCMTKSPEFQHAVDLVAAPAWLPPIQLQAGVMINIPGMPSTPVPDSDPLRNKAYDVECNGQEPTRSLEILVTKFFGELA